MRDSRGNPLVALVVGAALFTACALGFAFVMTWRGSL